MTDRPVLQPTADHPITVTPTGARVTVAVNGELIADTTDAVTLQESNYPAVQYIPMDDVIDGRLQHSATTTYCPFKGEAAYFHVAVGDGVVEDAVWTYREPYPAVDPIAGRVAFYPDKAEITVG